MDTLVLRVPLLSERGGDSRFGTLPPWRELVKDELLSILSHCCFPQKLIVIPAQRAQCRQQILKKYSWEIRRSSNFPQHRHHISASRPKNHFQIHVAEFVWTSSPDSTGPSDLTAALCCATIRSLGPCSRAVQGRLVRLLQGTCDTYSIYPIG